MFTLCLQDTHICSKYTKRLWQCLMVRTCRQCYVVEDDKKSMWNWSAATAQKCTPMLGNKTILPKFSIFCVNSTASKYSFPYSFKSWITNCLTLPPAAEPFWIDWVCPTISTSATMLATRASLVTSFSSLSSGLMASWGRYLSDRLVYLLHFSL